MGQEHDFFDHDVDIFNVTNRYLTHKDIPMNTKLKLLTAIALGSLSSAFQLAIAALPTAAGVSTGAGVTNTTSPVQFLTDLMSTGVGTAAVGVSALTVLGVAWTSYAAFVESRQKGEWKNFGVTASIGVVLVVGVVLMAILAVDYAA
jgi:hypothetical protein